MTVSTVAAAVAVAVSTAAAVARAVIRGAASVASATVVAGRDCVLAQRVRQKAAVAAPRLCRVAGCGCDFCFGCDCDRDFCFGFGCGAEHPGHDPFHALARVLSLSNFAHGCGYDRDCDCDWDCACALVPVRGFRSVCCAFVCAVPLVAPHRAHRGGDRAHRACCRHRCCCCCRCCRPDVAVPSSLSLSPSPSVSASPLLPGEVIRRAQLGPSGPSLSLID